MTRGYCKQTDFPFYHSCPTGRFAPYITSVNQYYALHHLFVRDHDVILLIDWHKNNQRATQLCKPFKMCVLVTQAWWRHQMETFSALLTLCAGNSPVPAQRPVTRSFHVFFDLRLNKPLSKQSWYWRFETLSRSLWRHRNENPYGCKKTNPSKSSSDKHFQKYVGLFLSVTSYGS